MHTEIDTEPEAEGGAVAPVSHHVAVILERAAALKLDREAPEGTFLVEDGEDPDAPIPYALTPLAEADAATRRASERLLRAAAKLDAAAAARGSR